MILYLYALADRVERVDQVTGVCGETPIVIPTPVCLIVGSWIAERPALDRESLSKQDSVIRRIHALAPAVLPVRFGTAVADADAAARAISALGPSVRERLDLVRNREQMTLRVSGPPSRPEAATARSRRRSPGSVRAEADASSASSEMGAGRRYLERRAALKLPDEVQPLLVAIEPLRRAVRVDRGRHQNVVTVYHLIDRGRAAEYVEATTSAARELPYLTVRISGPFPAYAFADVGRLR